MIIERHSQADWCMLMCPLVGGVMHCLDAGTQRYSRLVADRRSSSTPAGVLQALIYSLQASASQAGTETSFAWACQGTCASCKPTAPGKDAQISAGSTLQTSARTSATWGCAILSDACKFKSARKGCQGSHQNGQICCVPGAGASPCCIVEAALEQKSSAANEGFGMKGDGMTIRGTGPICSSGPIGGGPGW